MENHQEGIKKQGYLYIALYAVVGLFLLLTFKEGFLRTTEKIRLRDGNIELSENITRPLISESLSQCKEDTRQTYRIIRNRLIRNRLEIEAERLQRLFNILDLFDQRRENLLGERAVLLRGLQSMKPENVNRTALESTLKRIALIEGELAMLDAEEISELGKVLSAKEALTYIKIKRDALALANADKASEQ